jgi:hypothetical protein
VLSLPLYPGLGDAEALRVAAAIAAFPETAEHAPLKTRR